MTNEQLNRIAELRAELDHCAKPLGSLELLRQMLDELLAILLNQPGETQGE
jgi:hypothetical protein